MSANVPASSGAGPKAAASARMPRRLAFAVSLTVLLFELLSGLLSGAAVSASGEDGPMASAPLPPPLPAAPPATGLQQPQGEPSSDLAARAAAVPSIHGKRYAGSEIRTSITTTRVIATILRMLLVAKNGSVRVKAGDAEHRKRIPLRELQALLTPPPAPLPFSYRYNPAAPPSYGYAPIYPPPRPPGPVFPR